jgi:signal transduction histidine kinase
MTQTLTELRTELMRLDELAQDYLSLVRVGMLELAHADLGRLVAQCAQDLTPALAAHGVTLQLDRAVVNLVANARDAMPQGATVHLDVEDTGIGIAPERYSQIFEPLHTTKPGAPVWTLYRAGGDSRAWRAGRRAE